MSLNKFKDCQTGRDLGLEIGCVNMACETIVCQTITMPVGGDIAVDDITVGENLIVNGDIAEIGGVNFKASNSPLATQVLRNDGVGGTYWDDVSGGGGGTETLQEGFNVSTQPQITTSDTVGKQTLELRQGGTSEPVLQIKDAGNAINTKINSAGLIESKCILLNNADDHIELQNLLVKKWRINSDNADANKLKITDSSDTAKITINQAGTVDIPDAKLTNVDVGGYTLTNAVGLNGQILTYNTTGDIAEWDTLPASSSTLQEAYDLSTQPQFLTDATNPTMSIKKGALAVGDIFDIVNNSDVSQLKVAESGITTIKNLQIGSAGVEYNISSAQGANGQVLTYNTTGDIGEWSTLPASSSTLQEAYDSSTNPQFLTDATNPTMSIKKGALAVGDIFDIVDNSDVSQLKISQTGLTTVKELELGVGATNYKIANTRGTNGQVLTYNTTGDIAEWAAGGGGGSQSLQQTFDLSTPAIMTTDLTRTKLTVKQGSGVVGDIFEVLDSSDNALAAINADGIVANSVITKEPPLLAELVLGEWDFSDILPSDITETSATIATFNSIANIRAITSKAYIVPEDISIGAFAEWSTNYNNVVSTVDMCVGVVFKSPATVLSGFGSFFGKGEYYTDFKTGTNFITSDGVKQGNQTPNFIPSSGTVYVKITRTSAVLWTISWRVFQGSNFALSETATFDDSRSQSFLYLYAGLFNSTVLSITYSNQTFTQSGWSPSGYNYYIKQNENNELACVLENDSEVWSSSANAYKINKPLITAESICCNLNLFNFGCCITSTFYKLVVGKTVGNGDGVVDITDVSASSNIWGGRAIPKIQPGCAYTIRVVGLISSGVGSVLELKLKIGPEFMAQTFSGGAIADSISNNTFILEIEVNPQFTAFGQGLAFCSSSGMFKYDSVALGVNVINGMSISSVGGTVSVPLLNSGDMTLTAEWLAGSPVQSSLTVHSVSYTFEGFNI